MREHRERARRQLKARQRWGKAIERVRRQVREQLAARRAAADQGQPSADQDESQGEPSEGRGARRGEPRAAGAYKESRAWTRRGAREAPKRRIATMKEGANGF